MKKLVVLLSMIMIMVTGCGKEVKQVYEERPLDKYRDVIESDVDLLVNAMNTHEVVVVEELNFSAVEGIVGFDLVDVVVDEKDVEEFKDYFETRFGDYWTFTWSEYDYKGLNVLSCNVAYNEK